MLQADPPTPFNIYTNSTICRSEEDHEVAVEAVEAVVAPVEVEEDFHPEVRRGHPGSSSG